MIGVVLALLAALFNSGSTVLVRKELDKSNFVSVSFVVTLVGNIILWPLALSFTDLGKVNLSGVVFFAISGTLAQGIARLFYYKGMQKVGASVNAVVFATYPVYTLIFAIMLLSEALDVENLIGILLIVAGVASIEMSSSYEKTGLKRIFRKALIFPLLAGLTIAFAFIVRKQGLDIYNEPLLGVAVGYMSSFMLYIPLLIFSHARQERFVSRKGIKLFWKAGVGLCFGWVLAFIALSYEKVLVVSPLMQTEPLFVILFASLYLRESERISLRIIMGALLVVLGVLLVSVW